MTMTERLLEATKEIWAGYNEKPFVKGIADGSLDHDKFKYYMIQDYLYLIDYTKVFSIGAAKSTDLAFMRLFAGYTTRFWMGRWIFTVLTWNVWG
ncbi:hypothetical protein [Clostridium sp. AF29-8BH]|uniref:hypothetical protein n=1 Tax=Clostridium sp. AF29-8BH TaxID=2293009 RepID=UPI0026D0AA4F